MPVTHERIETSPSFGAGVDTDFILGMGMPGQEAVMLLDVGCVFAEEVISIVEQITNLIEDKDVFQC